MLKVSRGTTAAYLAPMFITIALVSGTPIVINKIGRAHV